MSLANKANFVAWVHLGWYVIVILLLPLLYFFDGLKYFALALILSYYLVAGLSGGCPFRQMEIKLRREADPSYVYNGTFVTHYLNKIFNIKVSLWASRLIVHSYTTAILLLSLCKIFLAN